MSLLSCSGRLSRLAAAFPRSFSGSQGRARPAQAVGLGSGTPTARKHPFGPLQGFYLVPANSCLQMGWLCFGWFFSKSPHSLGATWAPNGDSVWGAESGARQCRSPRPWLALPMPVPLSRRPLPSPLPWAGGQRRGPVPSRPGRRRERPERRRSGKGPGAGRGRCARLAPRLSPGGHLCCGQSPPRPPPAPAACARLQNGPRAVPPLSGAAREEITARARATRGWEGRVRDVGTAPGGGAEPEAAACSERRAGSV